METRLTDSIFDNEILPTNYTRIAPLVVVVS